MGAHAGKFEKLIPVLAAFLLYGNIYCVGTNIEAMNQGTQSMEFIMSNVISTLNANGQLDPDKEYVFIGNPSASKLFRKNELWDSASYFARSGSIFLGASSMIDSYNGVLMRLGMNLKMASTESYEEYMKSEEVEEMPCYPAEGSIVTRGEQVIVKISDEYEK